MKDILPVITGQFCNLHIDSAISPMQVMNVKSGNFGTAVIEGYIVAISATDGSAFKRIGRVGIAPHVRLFESISGLGESMLGRTEDIEDTLGVLLLL